MAPTQPIQVLDPLPWHRSKVTEFAMNELVNGGQLALNVEGQLPAWIVLPVADREPNPLFGYVVSFIQHHERGFTAPASCFCPDYATTTGCSCTTSPPTRFRGRPPLSASARGSWGSP
jgi:hypothetical protein